MARIYFDVETEYLNYLIDANAEYHNFSEYQIPNPNYQPEFIIDDTQPVMINNPEYDPISPEIVENLEILANPKIVENLESPQIPQMIENPAYKTANPLFDPEQPQMIAFTKHMFFLQKMREFAVNIAKANEYKKQASQQIILPTGNINGGIEWE